MSRRRRVSEEGDIFEAQESDEDEGSIGSVESGEAEETKKVKEGNVIRIEKRPVSEADDSRIMKDGDNVKCEESDLNQVKESKSEIVETAKARSEKDDTGGNMSDSQGDSNGHAFDNRMDVLSRKLNEHDDRTPPSELIEEFQYTHAMFAWSDKPETLISGTLNQQYTSECRAKEDQRISSWDFDGIEKWGHDNFEALANGQLPLPPRTAWGRNSGYAYARRRRGSPRRFRGNGRGRRGGHPAVESPNFPNCSFQEFSERRRPRRPGRRREYQSAEQKKSDFDAEFDIVDSEVKMENIEASMSLSDEQKEDRSKRSARFSKM
eukprot:GHVP01054377.1.p2 GENE.GHVP01054377.1~~GHVP01054377.1.p2  ORF type:complete len:329 (-),score=66.15 GHVP01054377.1:2083-3048(-)